MLVKLTDIHIAKVAPVVAPTNFPQQTVEQSECIWITDLNYDSLLYTDGNFDDRILKWAGEDLLHGKYFLVGSGSNGRGAGLGYSNTTFQKAPSNQIQISPQFLYYYLYLKRNQLTVTTKKGFRISKDKLSKLAVPVPGINAQLSIVSSLKKLVEKNDAHIAKTRKQLMALEEDNRLAFTKAFKQLINFLNLPVKQGDAKIARMKDAGQIQAGKTPNGSIKAYFGNSFPFFTQLAFEQGKNIEAAAKYLSDRGIREARLFEKNSILVCFMGPQFGKAGIARKAGACNSQVLSVTCSNAINPEYLYYQVISPVFQQQMKQFSSNSSISKADFERLFIELPSLKKQLEVVEYLEKQQTLYVEKTADLRAGLEKMEARQSDEFVNLIVNSKL